MGEWIENEKQPILNEHVGETLLIRFKDRHNGISNTDTETGEDYTVDITWMRSKQKGIIYSTTGTYLNKDIEFWKRI